jgi:hypothetical protein
MAVVPACVEIFQVFLLTFPNEAQIVRLLNFIATSNGREPRHGREFSQCAGSELGFASLRRPQPRSLAVSALIDCSPAFLI